MVAYNVVLVSSVQQTESVIHTHVSTLFQISFRFWSSECIESSSLCHVVGSHLLFALYIVRAGCGTADWLQIGKGVHQGCILSPCLFNLYCRIHHEKCCAGGSTPGIKIARRNINNLRYADDTTLMAESEKELKSLLMKVKESEKVGLKLNIQKTKMMASGPITSWETDGETVETVPDFIFLGSKITADGDCSHEIKKCLLLGRKVMTNLDSILKSRDIALPTKVCLVKAMAFPVSRMDVRVGL